VHDIDQNQEGVMKNDGTNRRNASDRTSGSHPSHNSSEAERILPPRGDYQTLLSYQKAEVIYDITFRFAHKYLGKGDRTGRWKEIS
jgi:hypothetical protein